MGLDRIKKTPCGFCFVEYFTHEATLNAMRDLNLCVLDERIIRLDWVYKFTEGRQYGRGKTGGQVRDEIRENFDAARGGLGKMYQQTSKIH